MSRARSCSRDSASGSRLPTHRGESTTRCRRSRQDVPSHRTETKEWRRSRTCRMDTESQCTFRATPAMRREDRIRHPGFARPSSHQSRDGTDDIFDRCARRSRVETCPRRRRRDTLRSAGFLRIGFEPDCRKLHAKSPRHLQRIASRRESSAPACSAPSDPAGQSKEMRDARGPGQTACT